jgi:hypothetical protein
MKIHVKLAACCQLFLFNFDGVTVTHCHKLNNDQVANWINAGDIRVMYYPFVLPDDDIFASHCKLTAYLKSLGQKQEGYDIGAFFNLPETQPSVILLKQYDNPKVNCPDYETR